MFDTTDTILAIATPAGRGGLGVVRLSGPDAAAVAERILTVKSPLRRRHATLSRLRTSDRIRDTLSQPTNHPSASTHLVDQVIATAFPAPASYTGENVVEISAHGSPIILRQIVDVAIRAGARLAEPGEFTLRAFLNGKLDLVQAEAVRDLIDAVTPGQARAAFDQLEGTLTESIARIDQDVFDMAARLAASLDFPEEGYHFIDADTLISGLDRALGDVRVLVADGGRGRIVREGRQVAIVGRPNVGKSSLFNALLGTDRAIVTARAGTTRDLVTERMDLAGVPVTLVDTAGVRDVTDEVEREGVQRSLDAIEIADVILLVLDLSQPLTVDDAAMIKSTQARARVVVANKMDLPSAWDPASVEANPRLMARVSATGGGGLADVRDAMLIALGSHGVEADGVAVTNLRHVRLLEEVEQALERALVGARARRSEEFLLADLLAARVGFESITGKRTSEDLLEHIFSSFCIGK